MLMIKIPRSIGLTEASQTEYDVVESRIVWAVEYVDKSYRKARKGQIPFLKKAQKIMGAFRIVKLIKKRETTTKSLISTTL